MGRSRPGRASDCAAIPRKAGWNDAYKRYEDFGCGASEQRRGNSRADSREGEADVRGQGQRLRARQRRCGEADAARGRGRLRGGHRGGGGGAAQRGHCRTHTDPGRRRGGIPAGGRGAGRIPGGVQRRCAERAPERGRASGKTRQGPSEDRHGHVPHRRAGRQGACGDPAPLEALLPGRGDGGHLHPLLRGGVRPGVHAAAERALCAGPGHRAFHGLCAHRPRGGDLRHAQ